nr:hemerythrin domain-containing protein [uncultured Pseudomonas sp.]
MNAIDLLKADHQIVKEILTQLQESSTRAVKGRTQLLYKLEAEVSVHTKLEEELLYPAFKEAGGKEEAQMFYEAKEEHRTVDSLVLPDLKGTDPSTPEFTGRVKVIKELLEHHIDEEERELFPRARKLLSKSRLDEMGEQMAERKTELKKQIGEAQKQDSSNQAA